MAQASSKHVVLPPICVNEDLLIMDERGRLNFRFLSGYIDYEEFSDGIRSTLMEKGGLLMFSCMEMRRLSTVRDLAVCSWHDDSSIVYMPGLWMKKMRIPTRRNNNSTVWSASNVVNGDYGILMRYPSISDNSAMPIKMYGWISNTIGVHPAMCEHLNLDFDGDEVHIAAV